MTGAAPSEDRLRQASDLLKVLSHPARLRLACRLAAGECSVAEMERDLGIRQPNLSQHLGELREAALVATRREHKNVFYTLTDPRALALVAALDDVFSGRAPRVARRGAAPCTRHDGVAMFAVVGDDP